MKIEDFVIFLAVEVIKQRGEHLNQIELSPSLHLDLFNNITYANNSGFYSGIVPPYQTNIKYQGYDIWTDLGKNYIPDSVIIEFLDLSEQTFDYGFFKHLSIGNAGVAINLKTQGAPNPWYSPGIAPAPVVINGFATTFTFSPNGNDLLASSNPTSVKSTECSHKWKSYVGFIDRFDFCELCQEKRRT